MPVTLPGVCCRSGAGSGRTSVDLVCRACRGASGVPVRLQAEVCPGCRGTGEEGLFFCSHCQGQGMV